MCTHCTPQAPSPIWGKICDRNVGIFTCRFFSLRDACKCLVRIELLSITKLTNEKFSVRKPSNIDFHYLFIFLSLLTCNLPFLAKVFKIWLKIFEKNWTIFPKFCCTVIFELLTSNKYRKSSCLLLNKWKILMSTLQPVQLVHWWKKVMSCFHTRINFD